MGLAQRAGPNGTDRVVGARRARPFGPQVLSSHLADFLATITRHSCHCRHMSALAGLRRYPMRRRIRLVNYKLALLRPHMCLLKCVSTRPRLRLLTCNITHLCIRGVAGDRETGSRMGRRGKCACQPSKDVEPRWLDNHPTTRQKHDDLTDTQRPHRCP